MAAAIPWVFLGFLQVHVWTLDPLSLFAEDQSEMKDVCIKLQKFLGEKTATHMTGGGMFQAFWRYTLR